MFLKNTTALAKKVCPTLRDPASDCGASSRNLGHTFLAISVFKTFGKQQKIRFFAKILKMFLPCFGSCGSSMESSRGLMRAPMTHAFRHIPAKMTFAPLQPKVSTRCHSN